MESVCGRGTTFSVTMPFGRAHLPADRIGRPRETASTAVSLDAYVVGGVTVVVGRRGRYAANRGSRPDRLRPRSRRRTPQRPRILLADDNADMRIIFGACSPGAIRSMRSEMVRRPWPSCKPSGPTLSSLT